MVLVLGREIVNGQSTVYLCLSKYIVFENTHTHIATTAVASGTEGVAAVSCMESHMNRRPLGSIDPNSIREAELHTECRRRRERESYTARSMTGTGMLLVRGLRLRAGWRQMRHGRKGCWRTDKEKIRGASTDTTSQACSGKTTCCCGSAVRKGCRQSEANERGCCEAQRPGEF